MSAPAVAADRPARRLATVVLAAATAVALTLSTVAVWLRTTALDTERFMAVVEPVLTDDVVLDAVGERLTAETLELLAVEQRIEEVLLSAQGAVLGSVADALDLGPAARRLLQALGPEEGLERLAGPLADGIEQRVAEGIDRLVTAPEVRALLVEGVEGAHARAVLLVRGELDELPAVTVADGVVFLDLRPLVGRVLLDLRGGVLDLLDIEVAAMTPDPALVVEDVARQLGVQLDPGFARVPVTAESELVAVQDAAAALDRGVWAILLGTVLLAGATVVLAHSPRRAATALTVASLLAAGASVVAIRLAVRRLGELAASPSAEVAVVRVADAVVGQLRSVLVVVLVVAATVALALLLSGRSTTAGARGGRSADGPNY